MMFQEKKGSVLPLREASLSVMKQARSYLALIPNNEWQMTEEQSAETQRHIYPPHLMSEGTVMFLLGMQFPFPGFAFSAVNEINIDTVQSKQSLR